MGPLGSKRLKTGGYSRVFAHFEANIVRDLGPSSLWNARTAQNEVRGLSKRGCTILPHRFSFDTTTNRSSEASDGGVLRYSHCSTSMEVSVNGDQRLTRWAASSSGVIAIRVDVEQGVT